MSSYKLIKEDGDSILLETGDFLLQDPPLLVETSDELMILETVFLNNAYEVEDIFITENISITMHGGDVSVVDTVVIAETVSVLHNVWYAEITDSISASESLSFDWPFVVIANDGISIVENTEMQSIKYSSDNRKPRWPNGGVSGSISLIE